MVARGGRLRYPAPGLFDSVDARLVDALVDPVLSRDNPRSRPPSFPLGPRRSGRKEDEDEDEE